MSQLEVKSLKIVSSDGLTNDTFIKGDIAAKSYAVNKAGDTMTGALNLPAGGLNVGYGQLNVDSAGRVTMNSQPSLFLQGNVIHSYSLTDSKVFTNFSYDGTYGSFQSGGLSWNPTTGKITFPIAGKYLVSLSFYHYTTSDARLYITRNGVNIGMVHGVSSNGIRTTSVVINAQVNDYIQFIEYSGIIYVHPYHTYALVHLLG